MPTVTITHSDATTEILPGTVGWTWQREIGQMEKLTIRVPREDAQAVTLDKKRDSVTLDGVTTGRLVDVQKGGSTWTLVVYSFEWDANRHAPTAGGTRKQGDDAALMTEFINGVSEWSVGTVADLTGPMTYVFNHAQANEAMRRIEQNVPGELRWNADGSVDYVSALGSDKTGSVVLSAANGNIEGEIRVQDRGRDMDATHLRVIGAHEGEAQKFVNLVPTSDPESYENEVRYSQPRWSSAADTDWARWENKDVVKQDALAEEAASLGAELVESMVEVKATVYGEDLALGDTVTVRKPDADIDREMRVHRIKTVSEGATVRDECLLSTRTVARSTEQDRLRDIQRFNVAFQGSAVWGNPGGGIQAVDSNLNYIMSFYYPDVEYEHAAELNVKSLPYRSYSSGAASGGTTTSAENTAYGATTLNEQTGGTDTIPDTWSTLDSFSVSGNTASAYLLLGFRMNTDTVTQVYFRLQDDSGTYYPSSDGALTYLTAAQSGSAFASDGNFVVIPIAGNFDGETLSFQARTDNSGGIDVNLGFQFVTFGTHSHTLDTHTHDVNPGVEEFPSATASGCDVLVNGSTAATDVGSGSFETVVDISGELTRGAWNTVEVTSDSLGLLLCTGSIESYRQIGEG